MTARTFPTALSVAFLLTAVSTVSADSIPIPTGTDWLILSDTMTSGEFFTGGQTIDGITYGVGASSLGAASTWTWTSDLVTHFDITDWSVATDRFNVFDNGQLVLPVLGGLQWQDIPGCTGGPGDPTCGFVVPFDVDANFVSPYSAHASYVFGPGTHSIAIQDIDIPVQADDQFAPTEVPFPNGTVAFRTDTVMTPEPSTLALLALPLAGAGIRRLVRRFRRRHPPSR